MKRSRSAALAASVLVLGACAMHFPPEGYEPVATEGCPNLVGDYALATPEEALMLVSSAAPADLPRYAFLSVEGGPYERPRVVLRPRSSDVLMAALELRRSDPQRYSRWREAALRISSNAPGAQSVNIAELGPTLSWTRDLDNGGCEDGWQSMGMMDELPPRVDEDGVALPQLSADTAISRNEVGELIVRRLVFKENFSEFVFFGQPLRYNTYHGTEWFKLKPVPRDAVLLRLPASSLPEVVSETQHLQSRAFVGSAMTELSNAVVRKLPADAQVSIFRQTQFDPDAASLAANEVRVEIAGTYPAGSANPFLAQLQADPRIRDIEIKREDKRGNGRHYALLEFTFRM